MLVCIFQHHGAHIWDGKNKLKDVVYAFRRAHVLVFEFHRFLGVHLPPGPSCHIWCHRRVDWGMFHTQFAGTHPRNPRLADPYWLVVWNHGVLTDFPYIGNGITSQLTNIFQRGWNHQPAYSVSQNGCRWMYAWVCDRSDGHEGFNRPFYILV